MTWFARLYLWATYRLYDELAWFYDLASWLVSLGRWHGWRRTALDYLVGRRVLEVGFGTGELLLEMADRRLEVVGLEPSPAMHRITARKLARRCISVSRARGVAEAMPFSDGGFDSIVCTFPAGYILEPEALREMARLLRPPSDAEGRGGGRLIVVGMVVLSDSRLWRRAVRILFGAGGEPVLDRFAELARRAGLEAWVVDPEGKGWRAPVVLAEGDPTDGQQARAG